MSRVAANVWTFRLPCMSRCDTFESDGWDEAVFRMGHTIVVFQLHKGHASRAIAEEFDDSFLYFTQVRSGSSTKCAMCDHRVTKDGLHFTVGRGLYSDDFCSRGCVRKWFSAERSHQRALADRRRTAASIRELRQLLHTVGRGANGKTASAAR